MTETTLTIDRIRDLYSWAYAWRTADDAEETDLSGMREAQRAEFDRALAAHDADVWAEGFAAADINTPRSRKGHWEDDRPRKGLRTWIPDPLPSNPYAVVSPEGTT